MRGGHTWSSNCIVIRWKMTLPGRCSIKNSYCIIIYVFTVQVTWIFLRQVNLTMVLSYVPSPLLFQLFLYSGLVW